MKKTVIVFGILSGLISSVLMSLTLPFLDHGTMSFVIGYISIFLSLLLVFFGIRSYRESRGGSITFGRAFATGILITVISCVLYVATWEVIYFKFMPDFGDKYAAHEIAALRQKGATDAAIAAKKTEMDQMKVLLDNPLTNAAMTFIEPFPVGLIMTLVSAAILRKRATGSTPGVAQAA